MTAAEHTLVRDGAPHWLYEGAVPIRHWFWPWRSLDNAIGRAVCSCSWWSSVEPTTEARRQAHAKHTRDEAFACMDALAQLGEDTPEYRAAFDEWLRLADAHAQHVTEEGRT